MDKMISAVKIISLLCLCILSESFHLSMKSGGHNQNFKFLPLLRGSKSAHFPRIMQIAGIYPDMTPEDLLAPESTAAPQPGHWSYDFAEESGHSKGSVAIPGSRAITACIDPVVMIATNTALGVQLKEEVEMLVVVDRGDTIFSPEYFFVFKNPDNQLVLQWADKVEPGFEVLGRVALCTVPYMKSMAAPDTGFAEADGGDDDE